MKYDEVIKDFRELYRERVDQYVERYIQECYLRWCEENKGKDEEYFEISLNDFVNWLKRKVKGIDIEKKEVYYTAERIEDLYKTSTARGTSDMSYKEQVETFGDSWGVHDTVSMLLIQKGKSFVIYEDSIRLAKIMAYAKMNGQPIPLRDMDNSIFIGDGELFYINPARLKKSDTSMERIYTEEDNNKYISRINEGGFTFYFGETFGGGFESYHVLPLKDENGDIKIDFLNLSSYIKVNKEDNLRIANLLRTVLEKTSRSFVQFEKETELRKKLEELEVSLEGKEASVSALEEESETGKSRIETLTVENGRLTEENGTLKKKQQEQTAQIQTLQRNNGQLEVRAKQAEENSDTLRQRMEQLKQKVMQAVGKVPFVGKRVKAIFDEDVYTLPSQTQKKDDFRASLQMTEASTDDTESVSKKQVPSTRNRTDRSEEDELNL